MSKISQYLSQSVLNDLFYYNNGELFWKNCKRPCINGKKAGTKNNTGYRSVNIEGKRFFIHRIIYIMFKGDIDNNLEINHIDCNRENNKIENLELVTRRQNMQNTEKHKNGKLVGCYFDKKKNRWYSRIRIKNKRLFLGGYSTELEAHNAYLKELQNILKNGER